MLNKAAHCQPTARLQFLDKVFQLNKKTLWILISDNTHTTRRLAFLPRRETRRSSSSQFAHHYAEFAANWIIYCSTTRRKWFAQLPLGTLCLPPTNFSRRQLHIYASLITPAEPISSTWFSHTSMYSSLNAVANFPTAFHGSINIYVRFISNYNWALWIPILVYLNLKIERFQQV